MAIKKFTTDEIVTICSWYYGIRNSERRTLFDHFPIKFQWNLKKNMDTLFKTNTSFNEFRDELVNSFNDKYFSNEENLKDDKSLKDELREEYNKEFKEIERKLREVLEESNEVEIITMNLDSIIDKLSEDESFTMDDIYMISFIMQEE